MSGEAFSEGRCAPVIYLDSVDSTNTYMKSLAAQGSPHGSLVVARQQTGGRGRLGRSFVSPPGGLYMSMLWRPQLSPEQAARLSCAVAIALCRALEESCGVSPDIKWPNDLLLGGKKLCGILSEALWQPDGSFCLIIGCGININAESFPGELAATATSLYLETGRRFEPEGLAESIIPRLDGIYDSWGTEGAAFLPEYRRRCVTPGKDVLIDQAGQRLKVRALAIDEDYSLRIRWPDGRLEKKSFGEIFPLV